jgi:hypothetical protein
MTNDLQEAITVARSEIAGIARNLAENPEAARNLLSAATELVLQDAAQGENLPTEAHIGGIYGHMTALTIFAEFLLDRVDALEGKVLELTLAAPATDTEV